MKILVACEESQLVCKAFREKGHEAYSCDILPCSGGHPEWHFLGLHPPCCTSLSLSGNRWYGKNMPRNAERLASIEWTKKVWDTACLICDKVYLENPASVIFKHLNYDDICSIQPWQHGHGEQKLTRLALKGLPKLEPSDIVEGREQRIWKMPPSEDRAKLRSKTYAGIAKSMANQWG